jgi:hypothetical protein
MSWQYQLNYQQESCACKSAGYCEYEGGRGGGSCACDGICRWNLSASSALSSNLSNVSCYDEIFIILRTSCIRICRKRDKRKKSACHVIVLRRHNVTWRWEPLQVKSSKTIFTHLRSGVGSTDSFADVTFLNRIVCKKCCFFLNWLTSLTIYKE